MINNKLVFGIGTVLVLMTMLTLNIPSKAIIAQQQGEEKTMIPMDKITQNMTKEEISKTIMQTVIDEIKKRNPMYADIIDKIPTMSMEETLKSLLAVDDLEQLLKIHAQSLVEGKAISSNETTITK
ncbi:MAG TPA: hypothetical protein VJ697_10390 [Nitrososphaeraceae archaeon]|nr:hypothetical protein [Nitrososphaeraceae archaeon]